MTKKLIYNVAFKFLCVEDPCDNTSVALVFCFIAFIKAFDEIKLLQHLKLCNAKAIAILFVPKHLNFLVK